MISPEINHFLVVVIGSSMARTIAKQKKASQCWLYKKISGPQNI